uniref:(northern house mosquito) hypothetical protein n=1 Tax=Culex pipiens TaxID=7175 RepID=A0A8D8JJR1_CULPI
MPVLFVFQLFLRLLGDLVKVFGETFDVPFLARVALEGAHAVFFGDAFLLELALFELDQLVDDVDLLFDVEEFAVFYRGEQVEVDEVFQLGGAFDWDVGLVGVVQRVHRVLFVQIGFGEQFQAVHVVVFADSLFRDVDFKGLFLAGVFFVRS